METWVTKCGTAPRGQLQDQAFVLDLVDGFEDCPPKVAQLCDAVFQIGRITRGEFLNRSKTRVEFLVQEFLSIGEIQELLHSLPPILRASCVLED